jgi:hypothetical protein
MVMFVGGWAAANVIDFVTNSKLNKSLLALDVHKALRFPAWARVTILVRQAANQYHLAARRASECDIISAPIFKMTEIFLVQLFARHSTPLPVLSG